MSGAQLQLAQILIAALLLGLALVALPRAYLRAWRFWSEGWDSPVRVVAGAVVLAAVLRWLVAPHAIATVFIGYRLTQQAIDLLPVGHYGAGTSAFYHLIFRIAQSDHHTLMWVNSIVGVLSLPLWATLGARLMGDRRTGAFFAFIVAALPLFVRNDNSDANNVPTMWWLVAGLVLWEEYLSERSRVALVAAASMLTLAAVSRPEMPMMAAMLVVIVHVASCSSARPWREPLAWGLVAIAGLLIVPHMLHVMDAISGLRERSSLPGFSAERLRTLPHLLGSRNAVLDNGMYPLPLVLAALGAAAFFPVRRWAPVALAAFVAVVLYIVDLDRANMARVHVPAAVLTSLLAAGTLACLWERLSRPVWRAAGGGLLLLSLIPSATTLFAPTNDDAEERLVQATMVVLPKGSFTFVRQGFADRDAERDPYGLTHLHFPDYLLRAEGRQGRSRTVAQFMESPSWEMPVYFFAGMRCHAVFRPESIEPPKGEDLQPACRLMHEQFRLEPVIEWDEPNRGDVWLNYYSDASTLRIGLYRVFPGGTPPASAPSATTR